MTGQRFPLEQYGTAVVSTVAFTLFLVLGAAAAGAAVPGGNYGAGAMGQEAGIAGTTNLSDAEVTLQGETANASTGGAVAAAGDVNGDGVEDVVVGAPGHDAVGTNAGAGYLVYGPVDATEVGLEDADVTLYGLDEYDRAGWSVSTAGDLNDDGYADVVVGAPGNDRAEQNSGAAYVVYGGDSLPSEMSLSNADVMLLGGAGGDRAGTSVANTTAVTGSGAVVVGAPYHDDERGAAHVVASDDLAETVDLGTDATVTLTGQSTGDLAGWSVSHAGDVTDDGVDDLLVGAMNWTAEEGAKNGSAGAAYVVAGDDTGELSGDVSLSAAWLRLTGADDRDYAGYAVSEAGDVNDDGVDDVVVGAPLADPNGTVSAGTAHVVYGGADQSGDWSLAEADVTLAGAGEGDRAGIAVSSAETGDVTCDGVDDVLVGAPRTDSVAGNDSGAAYVVAGDASLAGNRSLADAHATLHGTAPGDRAGASVSNAGDVDGDSIEDVVVGAPRADSRSLNDAGAAYVLHSDCPADGTSAATPTPAETQTQTPTE